MVTGWQQNGATLPARMGVSPRICEGLPAACCQLGNKKGDGTPDSDAGVRRNSPYEYGSTLVAKPYYYRSECSPDEAARELNVTS